MYLEEVQVKTYKCILDSGIMSVERGITCIIGQNESGKTAMMESLYRLNPLPSGHRTDFDSLLDYPRHKRGTGPLSYAQFRPLQTIFALEPEEIQDIESTFGPGIFGTNKAKISKNYANKLEIELDINERAFVEFVSSSSFLPISSAEIATVAELRDTLQAMPNRSPQAEKLLLNINNLDIEALIAQRLEKRIPKFLYFDEFSSLPSRFSVAHVLDTSIELLSKEDIVARSLLNLAGITSSNFDQADSETRRVLLESSSRFITEQVFQIWSQGKNLRVDFNIEFQERSDDVGPPPYIDIRIWNDNHRVSLKFSERSKGFVWFFSFLITLYDLMNNGENLILLLDEPGLGLHAQAQKDLLHFMESQLSENYQVIFSTHSPFMVNPGKLSMVRAIEDDPQQGSIVRKDLKKCTPETLMPVRASLGQKISETLSLNDRNLLVERMSDILYLQVFSQHLRSQGRVGLDDNWTLFPFGSIENIPSFTALLDVSGKPAIIANVREDQKQDLLSYAQQNMLEPEKLFLITDFTGGQEGDLEDLMGEEFYLNLLRASGLAQIMPADLPPGSRIIDRVASLQGSQIDPLGPALHLLKEQDSLIQTIPEPALNRFEELFKRINKFSSMRDDYRLTPL